MGLAVCFSRAKDRGFVHSTQYQIMHGNQSARSGLYYKILILDVGIRLSIWIRDLALAYCNASTLSP